MPIENEYHGHRIVRHARNRQEVFKDQKSLGTYKTLGDAIQVARGREPEPGSRIDPEQLSLEAVAMDRDGTVKPIEEIEPE